MNFIEIIFVEQVFNKFEIRHLLFTYRNGEFLEKMFQIFLDFCFEEQWSWVAEETLICTLLSGTTLIRSWLNSEIQNKMKTQINVSEYSFEKPNPIWLHLSALVLHMLPKSKRLRES